MLGTLRLVLALMVALSHVDVGVFGLNVGVMAVVTFYLISGYVMTGLVRKHYASPRLVGRFYLDRALRIYPHYTAVAGLTLAWVAWTGFRGRFIAAGPSALDLVQNFTIVPMNFFMCNDALAFGLIPPSWSLGAEIQFYAVMPWLLLAGLRVPVFALSLGVYVCAVFGVLNPDWFAYRLLPGVLFMFLAGSWLYDLQHDTARPGRGPRLVVAAMLAAAGLAAALAAAGQLALAFNRETLLGLALGLPALAALAPRPAHRVDDFLGNLSYGVFLNHFFVSWAVFDDLVLGARDVLTFLALALVGALLTSAAIERPVLRMRRGLRRA
jgi:peptidoglycan/LPS O-acetylase OafA/YrhL